MGLDRRLERLARREWLETNGLGSYSSGTASGAATRRYHGLFVAALDPPVRRYVLLSHLDEVLTVDGEEYPLATNIYRDAVDPTGYEHLAAFEARPVAMWTFAAGGVELERRVWMPQGRQSVMVGYRVRGVRPHTRVSLSVRPFVAFRDFHALTFENPAFDATTAISDGCVAIRPYTELPKVFLHHNAREFVEDGYWYRAFEYCEEIARGFEGHEDLYSHGTFAFDLPGDDARAFVYASLERVENFGAAQAEALELGETARRNDRAARAARSRTTGPRSGSGAGAAAAPALDRWSETFATRLAEAAEQFIATRGDGRKTVIAGYHWFADWGRDTFIALPGLAMATGRWPLPHEILKTFAEFVDGGMIPNRFPEAGTAPEYNTVDAALWFVECSRRYFAESGDLDFARRELLPCIRQILENYSGGTRYGIHQDPADGLIAAGEPGVALTWMDAVVDGVPVTPRHGKPVEINALWYNALLAAADIADALGERADAEAWRADACRVRASFNHRFVNRETGWLYDVIDGPDGDDAACRPNQLFAISLHHAVLDEPFRRDVVSAVEARLLTPIGLRTLDPSDPNYRPRCEGSPRDRDGAYHNGTVWPWLLGPFSSAYLKACGRTPETLDRIRSVIAPLSRHLGTEGCLGQISEIADGDPPYTPRGAVAQAWSVAEIARVLLEDLREVPPS